MFGTELFELSPSGPWMLDNDSETPAALSELPQIPPPVEPGVSSTSGGPEPGLLPEPPASRLQKVLIVEDDRSSRRALVRLFRLKGWQVVEASTLAEAFAGLDSLPSCIVLDLMLPDGDGSDLLRHVRVAGLKIRVVVATGVADPARLKFVAGLGPDSLVHKPIKFNEVLDDCLG
jgi:CheY-like chemotaxis protein